MTIYQLTHIPVSACAAAKKLPPPGWTPPSQAVDSVFTPTGRDLGSSMNSSISTLWQALTSNQDLGAIHDIGAPIHVYPLYENAFRAHRGQSIKENNEESAKLYAEFSAVAEKQEYAWNFGKKDDESVIGTVGKKNRMICFPCEYARLQAQAPLSTTSFSVSECGFGNGEGENNLYVQGPD